LTVLFGCTARRPEAPVLAYAALTGRVCDSESGAPLDRSFVILRTGSAARPQMQVTGPQGLFAFDVVGERAELLVARNGFEDVRMDVVGRSDLTVALKRAAPWSSAERMQAPRLLQPYNPVYTADALERNAQGVLLVRCAVLLDTRIEGCTVLQGVPGMDDRVKYAYEHRRYAPAIIDGVPTEADFLFRMTLRLN
jgi:hypothetical protein